MRPINCVGLQAYQRGVAVHRHVPAPCRDLGNTGPVGEEEKMILVHSGCTHLILTLAEGGEISITKNLANGSGGFSQRMCAGDKIVVVQG